MTDAEGALEAIARAADDLVPQLTDRLVRHDLGEIEVSSGELRVRVARAARSPAAPTAPPEGATAGASTPVAPAGPASVAVASPAVGFFVYAKALGPGLTVEKGDALGQVEMLGIRHDVRAPRG